MVDVAWPMTAPTPGHRAREALLLCLAVPFLGILFGGVYSTPAIRLSRGRDPWLSLLLLSGVVHLFALVLVAFARAAMLVQRHP